MKYTITILILLLFFVKTALAQTYTGTVPNDLSVTTPTEGSTKFREINNSIREIKTVDKNLYTILAVGTTTTLTGTSTFIIGSSTTALTLNFPTASTIATSTCTKEYVILNRNTGTVTLNIAVEGISGSPTVSQNNNIVIYTDGTTWFEKRVQNAYNATNFGSLGTSTFARSGANSDITSITGLTTYLAIGQGGSGTNTAAGAASAFGVGTEDTPTLTGVVTTGSSTITTLTSTTGSITNQTTTTGTVTTLYSTTGNITNQTTTTGTVTTLYSTTGNVTNLVTTTGTVTTLNSTTSNITTGNITNQITTTGTVTTLNSTTGNITNLNTTTGTITNFNSTTGTVTTLYSTTGNITNLSSTSGTVTTFNSTTGNITNISGTAGTWTGNIQATTASGFPHLTKIIVSGTEGTGSVTLAAGQGITYSMSTVAGSSTIIITGVGTTSAGGWTDTGTQTIGIAGNQVLPHGTVTIDAAYGITGLTDAWIPNDISLNNLTQITTRNYNDVTGTATISPTTATITNLTATTGTVTTLTSTTATVTNLTATTGTVTTLTATDLTSTIASIAATTTTTLSGTTTTGRFFNAQSTSETATGSTTAFTDSSSSNHTLTPSGDAVLSTAQKKFGLSAGLFDKVLDYVLTPTHANWNFGQNDFTIEIQRKSTDTAAMCPIDWGSVGSDNYFYENSPVGSMALYLKSTGTDSAAIAVNSPFGTITTTTWTHAAISRKGDTLRGFTDGVQGGTWSVTGKTFDYSSNQFKIGIVRDLVNYPFNGYIDEVRVSNIARYTENFTEPAAAFANDANTRLLMHFDRAANTYFTNRLAYVPPGTSNAFLNILSDGTNSSKVEMVLGTETAFGSTTTHILQAQTGSRILFGFYDAYCLAEFKDIIGSGTSVQNESYEIAKKVNIVKSHPVLPNLKVKIEDAKAMAREDYLHSFKKSDIETYKNDHIAEYTTTEAGSISVNWTNLNFDAQAYHETQRKAEFEVLPNLNEKIREKKKIMESDKGITNISIIADDPTTDDLLKGADNRTASVGNQIGVLFGAFQRQTEEIGSLTAALENQKIAYNEEVDNLYKLVNAIIVALLAVGGVSGWSTIRRKRKGT